MVCGARPQLRDGAPAVWILSDDKLDAAGAHPPAGKLKALAGALIVVVRSTGGAASMVEVRYVDGDGAQHIAASLAVGACCRGGAANPSCDERELGLRRQRQGQEQLSNCGQYRFYATTPTPARSRSPSAHTDVEWRSTTTVIWSDGPG